MRDFINRPLLYAIPVFTLAVIVASALGVTFAVQAKSDVSSLERLNEQLRTRVTSLEYITQPPRVNVLSQEMGISLNEDGGSTISISKLIIEEVGLNTMVRAEIANKSSESRTYTIANRKASRIQEGYQEININSPYVVVPLVDNLTIDGGERKPIVVMVSKLDCDSYENTEAWISVLEYGNSQIQSELCLRILIKGH